MSTVKYTGARYVLKFAESWEEGTEYEALTALRYNDASYISKYPVPASIGNPADNPEYWIYWGSGDVAFEQLRQLVNTFEARLEDAEGDIASIVDELNSTITVKALYGRDSLTLVQTEGKNIVVDFAGTTDASRISELFRANNVTHIDYAICSHFHYDHFSGYEKVFEYCDSNTIIYRQMECTDINNPNYSYYLESVEKLNNAASAIGARVVIPNNGEKIEIGKNSYLEFWNTDRSYEASYMASWMETENPDRIGRQIPSFNNYSLITRVQNGLSSYVDCGDIETQAQRNNADDMQRATVVKNPHHASPNKMGYYQFFDNLVEKCTFYNITNNDLESQTFNFQGFQSSYLYRYASQIRNLDIYTNWKQPISFTIRSGKITNAEGANIDVNAGITGQNSDVRKTVRGAFPPAKLDFDNPNILLEAGVALLAEWAGQGVIFDQPIVCDSASSFTGNAPFMTDLKTIFGDSLTTTSTRYFLSCFDTLVATKASSTARRNMAYIYSTFVRDDFPNTGVRILTEGVSRTPATVTFDTPISASDQVNIKTTYPETTNLFLNEKMLAVLSNNVIVPLTRASATTFTGAAISRDSAGTSPSMTIVHIEGNILHTCENVRLTDGNTSQRQLAGLRNPILVG